MARRSLRNGKKMGGRDVGPVAAMPIGVATGMSVVGKDMVSASTAKSASAEEISPVETRLSELKAKMPASVTAEGAIAAFDKILTVPISDLDSGKEITFTEDQVTALATLLSALGKGGSTIDDALVKHVEGKFPGLFTGGGRRHRGGAVSPVIIKVLIGVAVAVVFFAYLYRSVNAAQEAYDLVMDEWKTARAGICTGEMKVPSSAEASMLTPGTAAIQTATRELVGAKLSSCNAIDGAFSDVANRSVAALNTAYTTARMSIGSAATATFVIIGYTSEQARAFISMVVFMFTGATPKPDDLNAIKGWVDGWGSKTPAEAEAEAIASEHAAQDAYDESMKVLEDAKKGVKEKEDSGVDATQEKRAVRTADLAVKLAAAALKSATLIKNTREGTGTVNDAFAAAAAFAAAGTSARRRRDGGEEDVTGGPGSPPFARTATKGKEGKEGRRGGKTRGKKSKRRVTRRKSRKATTVKFAY